MCYLRNMRCLRCMGYLRYMRYLRYLRHMPYLRYMRYLRSSVQLPLRDVFFTRLVETSVGNVEPGRRSVSGYLGTLGLCGGDRRSGAVLWLE